MDKSSNDKLNKLKHVLFPWGERADYFFFCIGRWLWIPVMIFGVWFSRVGFEKYLRPNEELACKFLSRTGIPCPGCGGTRAVVALFNGRIETSLLLNPVVIFAVLEYMHFMLLFVYRNSNNRAISTIRRTGSVHKYIHMDYYAYCFIIILLLQWVIKFIMILIL